MWGWCEGLGGVGVGWCKGLGVVVRSGWEDGVSGWEVCGQAVNVCGQETRQGLQVQCGPPHRSHCTHD